MKKQVIFSILFVALLGNACNKDYKAVKKMHGNWKITEIDRDGVKEDMNMLKIFLISEYEVGDSWFGEYDESNVVNGTQTNKNLDLQVEFSNKGKTATFFYNYGSINGFSETYEVKKMKKEYFILKTPGKEHYYRFEK